MSRQRVSFSDLIGKTLTNIFVSGDNSEITFITNDNKKYIMYHNQSCCESVEVEDICGRLTDLVGVPILDAYESTNSDNPKNNHDECFIWTFYNISTMKGYVTIRWYGVSNGYYSVSVTFEETH
jgi:hypothetical protein